MHSEQYHRPMSLPFQATLKRSILGIAKLARTSVRSIVRLVSRCKPANKRHTQKRNNTQRNAHLDTMLLHVHMYICTYHLRSRPALRDYVLSQMKHGSMSYDVENPRHTITRRQHRTSREKRFSSCMMVIW